MATESMPSIHQARHLPSSSSINGSPPTTKPIKLTPANLPNALAAPALTKHNSTSWHANKPSNKRFAFNPRLWVLVHAVPSPYGPKKYISKVLDAYEKKYGEMPKQCSSPLDKNKHLEPDDTPVLDVNEQKEYLSMIGALQWVVTLGRFNIATTVKTSSRFRTEPQVEHLKKHYQVYSYICQFRDGAICMQT